MALADLLPHLVSVKEMTATTGPLKGFTPTYAELYADVRAAVEDIGDAKRMELAQLQIEATHRVILLPPGDLPSDNRLAFGFEGKLYRVTGGDRRRTRGSIPTFLVFLCVETVV